MIYETTGLLVILIPGIQRRANIADPLCLLGQLIRVSRVAVLADPDLSLLLVDDVLDPDLAGVLLLELADEARVPQLRGDAQVLAAPQQGVGLAALAGRRYRLFGEVLAFAARLCDVSVLRLCGQPSGKPAGTSHVGNPRGMGEQGKTAYRPWTMRAYSLDTTFSLTVTSPLGARPQPPGPKAWFRMRRYLISGR